MEIWKDIKDFDGIYQVSNLGRVKSLNYNHTNKTKILKQVCVFGYMKVNLHKNGKMKQFSVHRLVAEAFIQNPLHLPQVNHKDENKTNNYAGTPENNYMDGNLEWCDAKYNNNYGTRIKRYIKTNTNGKLSKQVLQYTLDGVFIREWLSMRDVYRQFGFNVGNISNCCSGRCKSYKGFIWKYKERVD